MRLANGLQRAAAVFNGLQWVGGPSTFFEDFGAIDRLLWR